MKIISSHRHAIHEQVQGLCLVGGWRVGIGQIRNHDVKESIGARGVGLNCIYRFRYS